MACERGQRIGIEHHRRTRCEACANPLAGPLAHPRGRADDDGILAPVIQNARQVFGFVALHQHDFGQVAGMHQNGSAGACDRHKPGTGTQRG